ncbi:MAG: TrkA family potassium uptake protein [Candidatus Nanohaloarchaeota archaeon QJJ-7]|nr:TrkA family potassium uptake protein [Candidatus Nanohaloarchaeota archaeon QJJ-7]
MYVIVVGVNTISRKLIEDLSKNHDLVVVEEDEEEAERIYSDSAATVVNGPPTRLSVLEDAGISKADVLVPTLSDDNQNLVVSMIGKKYGVPKVVTRVENPEYQEIYSILEVNTIEYTDIVYGEFISAIEHPSILKVANIGKGKEILEIIVDTGSRLEDLRVDEVQELDDFPAENVEFSAVLREDEVLRPRETLRLKEEDSLVVIIDPEIKGELHQILE